MKRKKNIDELIYTNYDFCYMAIANNLGFKFTEIFAMFYKEHLEFEDIAFKLCLSKSTIQKRISDINLFLLGVFAHGKVNF